MNLLAIFPLGELVPTMGKDFYCEIRGMWDLIWKQLQRRYATATHTSAHRNTVQVYGSTFHSLRSSSVSPPSHPIERNPDHHDQLLLHLGR